MATETDKKQPDTKPSQSPEAAAPAPSTPSAQSATPAKPATSAKPKAATKPKPKSRAKTGAKSRTRNTASSSRSRAASKSRSRKPAPRAPRTETATTARTQAKSPLNGGQQLVASVIDGQERTVAAFTEYQTRAAELSRIPGATAVAEAQAQVLRSVTDSYVNVARAFLK